MRVPGVAVFLCRDNDTTPLALRADVEHTHTLHEKVVIVSVDTVSIPHVDTCDRCTVEVLGHGLFKVFHLTIRTGYQDKLNVPEALALARKQGLLERNLDLEHASYFVSRITITPDRRSRNAALAQEAVHHNGPQRVQPDRPLRTTKRPHRDDGLPGPALTHADVRPGRSIETQE